MLTDRQMLGKIIATGKTMRFWHKTYVKKKDRYEKKLALIEWKTAEREFDKCLQNFSQLIKDPAQGIN